MRKLKQSINQYRNINRKHFICVTSNPAHFDEVKKEAKDNGQKFRMINAQLYVEVLNK